MPTDDSAAVGREGRTTSLCVAIVTYNSAREIGACLTSLVEHCPSDVGLSVKVVDNASVDGTAAVIRELYSWVELYVSNSNDGFAMSTNRSIRNTLADHVLVLNPDTQLRPGTLAGVLEAMDERPDVGVVGCRLELADGTFDHASKRAFPDPANAVRYLSQKWLRRPITSTYLAQHIDEHGSGEVDAVNGAFMLVRREAIEQVGLLDERYWMYGEDIDWCRRFKLAGWKVYYDGTVSALHLKGSSSGRYRTPRVNWHFHRSMWRFYRKFDPTSNVAMRAAVFGGIALNFVASVAVSTVKRRLPARIWRAQTPAEQP